ncbi:MAG: YceH family protein [Arenimonas sp.]
MVDSTEAVGALALLSPIEARILGSLIEKQATTPESYPLTANALVVAGNQKTNREPVLELEPGEVGHALREMTGKGLVRIVDGARALRYEHRFASTYSITSRQQALLAVLLLRGPQTLAELHTRCERLAPFANTDEVRETLERLVQRTPTLVVNLGRGAGQREDRYMHLLCGPVSAGDFAAAADEVAPSKRGDLEARLDALESEVATLRRELDALRDR